MDINSDKLTRLLALLLKRKYQRRGRQHFLQRRTSQIATSVNGASLNHVLESTNRRQCTTLLPPTQIDSSPNINQRRKRKQSRF